MKLTWQDEVSPPQWAEWQDIARRASKAKKMHTSLGPEDYAASAIERLLEQKESNRTGGYDFAHPLMKVWSAMHEVEDAGARK